MPHSKYEKMNNPHKEISKETYTHLTAMLI